MSTIQIEHRLDPDAAEDPRERLRSLARVLIEYRRRRRAATHQYENGEEGQSDGGRTT